MMMDRHPVSGLSLLDQPELKKRARAWLRLFQFKPYDTIPNNFSLNH